MSANDSAIIAEAIVDRVRAALDLASKVERGVSTPDDEVTLLAHLTVVHDDLPTLARLAIAYDLSRAANSQPRPEQ